MENPFEALQQQMNRMEGLMLQILKRDEYKVEKRAEKPISIEEAAKLLGLSESAVYHNKKIPRHKQGQRLRFFESEILDYIKNGPKQANPSQPLHISGQRRNRRKIVS